MFTLMAARKLREAIVMGSFPMLKTIVNEGFEISPENFGIILSLGRIEMLQHIYDHSLVEITLESFIPYLSGKYGAEYIEFIIKNKIETDKDKLCLVICGAPPYSRSDEAPEALEKYYQTYKYFPSTLCTDLCGLGKTRLIDILYKYGFETGYSGMLNAIRSNSLSTVNYLCSRGITTGSVLNPELPNFAVSVNSLNAIKVFWDLYKKLPDENVVLASGNQGIIDFYNSCKKHL